MSSKIVIVGVILCVVVIGGIMFYALRPVPMVEMPPAANDPAVVAPSPVADEERELGAIPVGDLGKEMVDINAEIAK